MFQLLSNIIVSRFYKVNAGFFLFSFLILFAILPGPDTIKLHQGIMLAVVSSADTALVALAVCSLYNFKCIAYTIRELSLTENRFLYHLQGLSNVRQLILMAWVHLSIYMPMLTYGSMTAWIGFQSQHYIGGMFVLATQFVMTGIATYLSFRKINSTWKRPAFQLPSMVIFPNKNFFSYLIHYSLNNKKGAFISIKVFSMLALQFLVALNADKVSKENMCFLMLLSISAHALLPTYYIRFLETEMIFLRNLPLLLYKRLAQHVLTYSFILLPELCFLLYNELHLMSLSAILSLYLLAIVRLTLYSTVQYLPMMDLNKYTGIVFIMFFITIILLASFSLWLFICTEAMITVLLFSIFYYRFEPVLLKDE